MTINMPNGVHYTLLLWHFTISNVCTDWALGIGQWVEYIIIYLYKKKKKQTQSHFIEFLGIQCCHSACISFWLDFGFCWAPQHTHTLTLNRHLIIFLSHFCFPLPFDRCNGNICRHSNLIERNMNKLLFQIDKENILSKHSLPPFLCHRFHIHQNKQQKKIKCTNTPERVCVCVYAVRVARSPYSLSSTCFPRMIRARRFL